MTRRNNAVWIAPLAAAAGIVLFGAGFAVGRATKPAQQPDRPAPQAADPYGVFTKESRDELEKMSIEGERKRKEIEKQGGTGPNIPD